MGAILILPAQEEKDKLPKNTKRLFNIILFFF